MSWNPRRYHEGGYLIIDHRASPGMSPDEARACGFDPLNVGEGKILEMSTLTCPHCGTGVIKNPNRVRPRERCQTCNHYACDFCYADMQRPGYIHMTIYDKLEFAVRGKVIL